VPFPEDSSAQEFPSRPCPCKIMTLVPACGGNCGLPAFRALTDCNLLGELSKQWLFLRPNFAPA
jgi:hypothetical protein